MTQRHHYLYFGNLFTFGVQAMLGWRCRCGFPPCLTLDQVSGLVSFPKIYLDLRSLRFNREVTHLCLATPGLVTCTTSLGIQNAATVGVIAVTAEVRDVVNINSLLNGSESLAIVRVLPFLCAHLVIII